MIVVRLLGGLGNQMFQYSAARALALRHGVPLKLDLTFCSIVPQGRVTRFVVMIWRSLRFAHRPQAGRRYRRYSGAAAQAAPAWKSTRYAERIVPHHGTERHYHFDARLLEAGPNTYLEGFWQSPRYFEGCEEAIREEFTFKEPVPPRILELCRQLRDADSVCINVRRGDFVGNHFHGTMPVEYSQRHCRSLRPSIATRRCSYFPTISSGAANNSRCHLRPLSWIILLPVRNSHTTWRS